MSNSKHPDNENYLLELIRTIQNAHSTNYRYTCKYIRRSADRHAATCRDGIANPMAFLRHARAIAAVLEDLAYADNNEHREIGIKRNTLSGLREIQYLLSAAKPGATAAVAPVPQSAVDLAETG